MIIIMRGGTEFFFFLTLKFGSCVSTASYAYPELDMLITTPYAATSLSMIRFVSRKWPR